jgi:hypothetical protein
MRTRLRRRHKTCLATIYSGGGQLERRYLKKFARKTRRQIDDIMTREEQDTLSEE